MGQSEFRMASVTAAVAASVGMFIGSTPMIAAVASLFIQPISSEFGVSRTTYSLMMLVQPWVVALSAPVGGRLLDRFGTRAVVLPIVLVFGLSQWLIAWSTSLWQLLALFAVGGLCGSVHAYTAYTRVVSLWFAKHRGVVMGLVIALGSALGGAIIPQLVRIWIRDYGWHRAYFGMGCVILFYGLPVLLMFLREPAAATRSRTTNAEVSGQLPGFSRNDALRDREFWLILLSLVLAPFAIAGTIGHLFPMLTERGFSPSTAALALSSVYIGGMAGQLGSGIWLDRIDSPRVAIPFFALALIGVALVHAGTSSALLVAGALLLGVGSGSEIGIAAYLVSRFFGLRSYGAIYGVIFGAANAGLGLGILGMGQVHDRYGSYGPMGIVMVLALAAVIALLAMLGPYRYAKRPPGSQQSTDSVEHPVPVTGA